MNVLKPAPAARRYIKKFLTPLPEGDLLETPLSSLHSITKISPRHDLHILLHIQCMKYGDFLRTPYWLAISWYLKWVEYCKCSECRTEDRLHVHHKHYKYHGLEHRLYLDKTFLVVVCQSCHRIIHDVTWKRRP